MTRISAVVLVTAVAAIVRAGPGVCARAASPRGTNSAGTAQPSGGASNAKQGTGGLGSGRAKPPDTPSGDAVINQENAILDRKLKSICRGC